MHFFNFINLSEDDQLEVLWYNGEQIGRRKEGEHLVLLYQVEGFYVEVFYHTKKRLIERYLSFECTDKLEPYIGDMDISAVYRYMKRRSKNSNESFAGDLILQAQTKQKKAELKGRKGVEKNRTGLWHILLSIFQK